MNAKQRIIDFYEEYAEDWDQRYGGSYTANYFLQNRLYLLRELCNFKSTETVLELGCGTGFHLRSIAGDISSGIGTDLSHAMIGIANKINSESHLKFLVDDAETCKQTTSNSMDVVFFVGLLEHLPDPVACFTSSRRVLREKGALVGLTPNKYSPWYNVIKPIIGPVKHLPSDRFYSAREIKGLLNQAGFEDVEFVYWGLVPPISIGRALTNTLDAIEKLARRTPLRYLLGGIAFKASR